jgi:hypothetical protein
MAKKTKKQYKSPKTFIVKDNEMVYETKIEFFDEIKDRQEAVAFGVEQYIEIQRVLMTDTENDLYIGPMKVTTGLQRTIDELNHRFPHLIEEILSTARYVDGLRIGQC